MKVTVDGVELTVQSSDREEVIIAINDHLVKQGLIIEKIVSGAEEYFTLDTIEWDKISELLEIRTVTPVKLCTATLRDAHEYLERMISAFNTMAGHFRANEPEKGAQLLTSGISGIEWINEVIVKVEPVLGLDYSKMEVNGEKVTDFFMKYSSTLNQITDTFEKKDYFMTADLVEFELIPCLIGWQILFTQIITIFEKSN